jgi:predicted GIY-YIG superfamily endonuclease
MDIYIYVLINGINDEKYVGISNDIDRRLIEHNRGTNRYTKAFLPWTIAFSEIFPDYKSARVREKYLKSAAGRRFIKNHLNELNK